MLDFITKMFGGNKMEKDVKKLNPIVEEINSCFKELKSLSNDQLRGKTLEFRERIADYLKEVNEDIEAKKAEAENNEDLEVHEREAIYDEVDKQKENRDELLEEVLEEILPEAFAVMKETARRFSENETLEATATDLDRELVTQKGHDYMTIEGDKVIFQNSWDAAGTDITWKMVHFDVQLMGGVVLHQGKIAEMATGEGKTLVSTLPAYLNGLSGLGVHIVTVNDYLARRDEEWNRPVYEWLGLTTDCIDKYQPNSEERRNAYKQDVIYGTNNEFGFDYLRDNMVHSPDEIVQGKHHFTMVDEVDSVLIDDARTPLIISGPVSQGEDEQQFYNYKPRIEKIMVAQKKMVNKALTEAKKLIAQGDTDKESGGLQLYRAYRGLPKNRATIKFLSEEGNKKVMQETEKYYLGEQQRHMPEVYEELFFTIDEKQNSVDLTDKGIELLTGKQDDPDFFNLPDIGSEMADIERAELSIDEKQKKKDELLNDYTAKTERIHAVHQLLKAYTLFEKDNEYVVMDGKVKIVDEQTGRIMEGRRYSDGLHQAIEAKEDVEVEAATQTFATVTLQNYFRMYHKLAGMTGTAETEAGEFMKIYELDVVSIPTNLPIVRADNQDMVYKTQREKFKAVIDEIEALRSIGRPVLVGTTSVEVSELLGRMLRQKKIPHEILNAKHHEREAQIVAQAGDPGQITIATNMAGRGTDIKLGEGVKEAGGLAIVGTERHESRRVDRQLRGRSGRQGDPGSSQFFASLEDNLMRLFGSERIAGMMDKMGHQEGEVLQHSMITKSIEKAQKKVEENNFGIRKNLLDYDDVMNMQRDVIYKRRRHALYGDRLNIDLDNALFDICNEMAGWYNGKDLEEFKLEVAKNIPIDIELTDDILSDTDKITQKIYDEAKEYYGRKMEQLQNEVLPQFKQIKEMQGDKVENIVIPFTDGNKELPIYVNLNEALEDEGKSVVGALEKNITLAMVDESWKDHLRTMDDLRDSVQMASYEQKDPLVVYKHEAFAHFRSMLLEVNQNIISFLYRASISIQAEQPQTAMPANGQRRPQRAPNGMNESKAELDAMGNAYQGGGEDYYNEPDYNDPSADPVKQQPVQTGPKIGRNDPCPCGSGKKYKHCHGRNA